MNEHVLIALLTVGGVAIPSSAPANDAQYAAHGGAPVPVQNDTVRMISEEITMYEQPSGRWKVTAIYLFENTADEATSFTMGYPEFEAVPPREQLQFRELRTTVDGEPARHRVEMSAQGDWAGDALGRVHLFDVTIPSAGRTTVIHTFTTGASGSTALTNREPTMEKVVRYVTRTGALWKGTIERARFTIRALGPHELIAWTPSYDLESIRHYVVRPGERSATELVLKMVDWEPSEDLRVHLIDDGEYLRRQAIGGECPRWEITDTAAYRRADSFKEKAEFVALGDLSEFETARLRLCRNWIYALYGYPFDDAALSERFYGAIEVGDYPPHAAALPGYPTRRLRMAPLMEDESFDPNLLTRLQVQYVRRLRDEERRREAQ